MQARILPLLVDEILRFAQNDDAGSGAMSTLAVDMLETSVNMPTQAWARHLNL
ncbi:MAG: hypothetical protein JW888_14485 [Pirellulales bacterium]|nr:hypothetical protein [Pirellulales bacterium]